MRIGLVSSVLLGAVAPAADAALRAQTVVTGQVVDAQTNQPVTGAEVILSGPESVTLSRRDGSFELTVPVSAGIAPSSVPLEVRRIGYKPWLGTVDTDRTAVIVLDPSAIPLASLVVTGTPGEQRIRTLGNAIGTVEGELVDAVGPESVESLLTGTVAGVNVTRGGGEVGSGSNIRIRGASSISLSSQPLLYVDGIRVNGDNADDGGGITGVGVDWKVPPSRLNDLNPEDIESIEVLRGPSASTLYGTEASNGVISIITKRGLRTEPRLSMAVTQGGNWLPDPETYFPLTYYVCSGTSPSCTPGEVTPFNVLREDRVRNGNVWFRTGHSQGYSGSVSGGGSDVRYHVSGAWNRNEGFVSYNWQTQLRGRANFNWTPGPDWNVNLGLGTARSNLRSASANQPITGRSLLVVLGRL